MTEVYPNLLIGTNEDYEKVKDSKGWSWLRCCKYGPGGHQQLKGYHTLGAPKDKDYLTVRKGNLLALNLLDLHDPNYLSPNMIEIGLEFIQERLAAGDKVLVSDNQGKSRAPCIALLYLRSIGEMPYSLGMSERVFSALYPEYDPKQGLRQYLRWHWSDWVVSNKEHNGV